MSTETLTGAEISEAGLDGWVTLQMAEEACRFLREDHTCAIYPVRPKQCATWPFWEENLERERWEGPVRERCPGIGQGRLHSAEEIERLARETEEWYEGEAGQAP